MTATDSLKLRLERIHRCGDLSLENLKRFNHRSSVVESYLAGVLSLQMHITTIGPYAVEYFSGAALKAARNATRKRKQALDVGLGQNQMSVLVWVREGLKRFRPIDSFVRLVALDSPYVRIRKTSQPLFTLSPELACSVFDREL